MPTALFINGVFEDGLAEIREAQSKAPGKPHFLQPYASDRIALLANEPPTADLPRTLYLSVTTSLDQISYRAQVVGWRDKRDIGAVELEALNQEIKQFQPGEKEIYLTVNGKLCVNLISIIRLIKFPDPIPASCFRKVSNGLPLQKRSRAGGWSYVVEQPDWLGACSTAVLGDVATELGNSVRASLVSSAEQRQARLAVAPRKPEAIQVLSRAFRRNADVIVEVLLRAKGICEGCSSAAPFLRASDESPYLEVHHRVPLADGGDDTVDNAIALCPNCHREKHFGKVTLLESKS